MTRRQYLKKYLRSFCESTTLHGFRYIPDNNKCKCIVWFIACILSTLFCGYLIYLQLNRYHLKQINTSIETTGYPVWEVDFPAVTICSVNSVYKNKTNKFAKLLKRKIKDENLVKSFFEDLSNLVIRDETEINTEMDKYYEIIDVLDKEGYNSNVLMRKLAHPCESMIKKCKWLGQDYDCREIFQMILTSEGYCCAFNYEGTVKSEENRFYRGENRVSNGVGAFFGLQVQVDMEESEYISSDISSGINVLIHEKYDYPMMSLLGISVSPGNHITATLKPEVLISNSEIQDLKISQRACLFDDEGISKWSLKYSFPTCTREVYAEVIVKLCGCLPFYLPYSGPSVRYCNLTDSFCLQKHRGNFTKLANLKIKFIGGSAGDDEKEVASHCYPECDELSYNIHVDNHRPSYQEKNVTIIRTYYRSVGVTKMGRSLYFTWDTLLASLGGIFGLCLGGSVLSIVELFYFLLVHFIFVRKKRKSNVVTIYCNELLQNNRLAQNGSKFCKGGTCKYAENFAVKNQRGIRKKFVAPSKLNDKY